MMGWKALSALESLESLQLSTTCLLCSNSCIFLSLFLPTPASYSYWIFVPVTALHLWVSLTALQLARSQWEHLSAFSWQSLLYLHHTISSVSQTGTDCLALYLATTHLMMFQNVLALDETSTHTLTYLLVWIFFKQAASKIPANRKKEQMFAHRSATFYTAQREWIMRCFLLLDLRTQDMEPKTQN